MKKPANVADLTASLTTAATTPLVRPPANQSPAPASQKPKAQKKASTAVFLRVPDEIFARYDAEAIARTKASGKGVTVQQVMIEKLDGAL